MRTLLIDPPGPCKGLNVGLGYIASSLRDCGYKVYVLDLNNRTPGAWWMPDDSPPSAAELRRILEDVILHRFPPALIGISVKSFTAQATAQIMAHVREINPRLKIVVGGPHISLEGAKYLQETGADVGIAGEGEQTITHVCRALAAGHGLDSIKGVIFWDNREIRATPPASAIIELDRLGFPSYDAFSSVMRDNSMVSDYPLITSRGCPYHCTYCSVGQIMGKKWRKRSPQDVLRELTVARERYEIRRFSILDDNFTLDIERAKEICQALIEAGLDLPWDCPNGLRADRLDRELLKLMSQAGCTSISMGIESADERVLTSVKKGIELAEIHRAIEMTNEVGIKVIGFFIIGLPGSTMQADLKSVQFVKEHGIEGYWSLLTPYPHTELWDWMQGNAQVLSDYRLGHHASFAPTVVFETEGYTAEQRIVTYYKIHLRAGHFYRLVGDEGNRIKRTMRLLYLSFRYDLVTVPGVLGYFFTQAWQKLRHVLLRQAPVHGEDQKHWQNDE